jgi:hypothetical protein
MTAMSLRSAALYRRLAADVGTLGLPAGPVEPSPVTEAQLDGLPGAAQRYLRFTGAVGRPADWSFLAHVTGKFRMRPGLPWMRCEAWQYNNGPGVARLFHMRIDAAGVLPMTGRDAYAGGRGTLLATLAGRVKLADSTGPETDLGELVTYLSDAVLFAPSMLLVPEVRWAPLDDRSFEVTLGDHGHQVTGRVVLDERGAPVNFSTEDRWADLPGGLVRTRWSTPVRGWTQVNGRWQATSGAAIWHLPEGPFCYAIFRFPAGAVSYNVPPAELGAPKRAGEIGTGRPPGGSGVAAGQSPLPRGVAWPAVVRCVGGTARLLAGRRTHLPRGHVGMRLRFADGTSGRVYRETVVDTAPARPCILVVGFRLRAVRGSFGHALFRWESLLNTPLFAGFPGLVSKLWIAHDEHGVYRGLYEWDGPDQAEYYARCLWRVLELVCVPGTIHYHVLPGRSRGELLSQQPAPHGTGPADTAAWWQVISVT